MWSASLVSLLVSSIKTLLLFGRVFSPPRVLQTLVKKTLLIFFSNFEEERKYTQWKKGGVQCRYAGGLTGVAYNGRNRSRRH